MADDKTKTSGRDRATVSGSEAYEVEHFARENDPTMEQARELIAKHGNNRETLTAEVKKLRQSKKA